MSKKSIKIASLVMILPSLATGITAIAINANRLPTFIQTDADFKHELTPKEDGTVSIKFKICGISNPQDSKIIIPEFDLRFSQKIDNERQYSYTIQTDGTVQILINSNKLISSKNDKINFSIKCTNSHRKFNECIYNMSIFIYATKFILDNQTGAHYSWTNLPEKATYKNDIYASYIVDESVDVKSQDVKCDGISLLSHSDVIFKDGILYIPGQYVLSDIQITSSTQIKQFDVKATSDLVSYTLPLKINYGSNIDGTYSIPYGYELNQWDILINEKSIKQEVGVVFDNNRIFIPGNLIRGNVTITSTTQKCTYWLYTGGGDGFSITTTPIPESIKYQEAIELTYSLTSEGSITLTPYVYLVIGEEYYSLLEYEGVVFANGKIQIPSKYVLGNIVIYGATTNFFPVITQGSHITYSNFPKQIQQGNPVNGNFTLDTDYHFTNKSIYISNKLVYSNGPKSGYENIQWNNSSITIPGEYVTGIITITATTSNTYTVKTNSNKGVQFNCPSIARANQTYSGTYTLDDVYDISSKSIKCGGSDITGRSGVIFADGVITIPANLVTGDIIISITTKYKTTIPTSVTASAQASFDGVLINSGHAAANLYFYNSDGKQINCPDGCKVTAEVIKITYSYKFEGSANPTVYKDHINVYGQMQTYSKSVFDAGDYMRIIVKIKYFANSSSTTCLWEQTSTVKIGYKLK